MFENKDKIVIVMEYASRGDLYDYVCDKRHVSEQEARHFFRQIVSAVHYCHRVSLFITHKAHEVVYRKQNQRVVVGTSVFGVLR